MDTQNSEQVTAEEILRMTAEVVSAYLSNNLLPASQISEVIQTVHTSLNALGMVKSESMAEPPKPAVPVKKSVTPDYIVCLEDGKKLKMLKRHLRSTYNMTPDEYRAKWGLPADYPDGRAQLRRSSALNSPRRSGWAAIPAAAPAVGAASSASRIADRLRSNGREPARSAGVLVFEQRKTPARGCAPGRKWIGSGFSPRAAASDQEPTSLYSPFDQT